jgi:hypothetical protein
MYSKKRFVCPLTKAGSKRTQSHDYNGKAERRKPAASYPVPRLGTALEVADLICFAASEAAGYCKHLGPSVAYFRRSEQEQDSSPDNEAPAIPTKRPDSREKL